MDFKNYNNYSVCSTNFGMREVFEQIKFFSEVLNAYITL